MLKERSISIIIPAFNEAERIASTIRKILEYATGRFKSFEVIVINDGSTDDTGAIVNSLIDGAGKVKLINSTVNKGKGASLKKGVLSTSSDLILICDADLSASVEEFEKLLPWMQKGFDVVIGSRGLHESEIVQRQPWYRERMGKIFNVFVQTLVMRGIKDTQCGFKLFRGAVARRIYGKARISRFSTDVEVLFLSGKMGYAVKEVPIRWSDCPDSRVRLIRDSARMFMDLLSIRLRFVLGIYNDGADNRDFEMR